MEKNQKTLVEYEVKMTKFMEDSITSYMETENLTNRNSFSEEKNFELQNEASRLQGLNDQYLNYKKSSEKNSGILKYSDGLQNPNGDDCKRIAVASLNCQPLPESLLPTLSGPSIQSQSMSEVDIFSNGEGMQIDETPNIGSAGVCERIGVKYSESHNDEEIVDAHNTIGGFGFCDGLSSQLDVTTYNVKDLLKIHAECLIDFMQLRSSREDNLDYKCSVCLDSSPSTEKSCSQINSSEMGKQLSPLLPGNFHDNTRPNTCLMENFDAKARALLREFINKHKCVYPEVKYALRNGPPERLISLTLDFARGKPEVKYSKTFDSLVAAVRRFDNSLFQRRKQDRTQRRRFLKNLREDNPIADVLNELKCSLSKDLFNKQAIPSVIKTLTDREIMPDKTYLLFYVFHYIYILGCSFDSAINYFSLHPHEKVVLSSLFEVDEMKKRYLNNLIESAVESLHILFIRKPKLLPKGIFALCRVFAEICCQKNLAQKLVSLAADLLKKRHRHSTVMIACMVSVWSEPFEVTEAMSDEEKCLCTALAFGVYKFRHSHDYLINYSEKLLKPALKILEKHCPVPDNKVLEEVMNFLIAKIHLECDCGAPLDVENFLFAPFIIFASCSEWNWAQDNILKKHVIPSLQKYEQEQNEAAFAVFSDLYAEIFAYSSEKPRKSLLWNYVKGKAISAGNKLVKDCATVSYLRLLFRRKKQMTPILLPWLQGDVQNSKVESLIHCIIKNTAKSDARAQVLAKEDF